MNDKEQKRLNKLCGDDYLPKKLIYSDLLLLLQYDSNVRAAVRAIINHQDDTGEQLEMQQINKKENESPVKSPVIKTAPVKSDPLRQQLTPELMLLTLLNADAELAAWWQLHTDDNAGRQLMRLVAIAAQWERVLELWQRLADRCKTEQRPATANQIAILSGAVQIHNLIWRDKQATLQSVAIGAAFDYQQHERGMPTGETIRAEWLPGVRNPAGELQKKPLVAT